MFEVIERVREAIQKGRCVTVVGAGASVPTGGPKWGEYLREMERGLPDEITRWAHTPNANPTVVASWLQYHRQRKRLAPVRIDVDYGAIHRLLAGGRCPLYLTTNFDDAIGDAVRDLDFKCKVLLNDQLKELSLAELPERPVVVKLCSSTEENKNNPGALGWEDFNKLLFQHTGARELLITVLRAYTVLFVGCSLQDPLIQYALEECHGSDIGHGREVACLPSDHSRADVHRLEEMGVDVEWYDSEDKSGALLRLLQQMFPPPSSGPHRLLVFEPGTIVKARQVLDAVRRIAKYYPVERVGFVTGVPTLENGLRGVGYEKAPKIDVVATAVADIRATQQVVPAVIKELGSSWTALLAPDEFGIEEAASFAERWSGRYTLAFHRRETSHLSRDKRVFRKFLEDRFDDHPDLAPTPFKVIRLTSSIKCEGLLEEILACREHCSRHVVVKPPDAAASIGVRSIDLDNESSATKIVSEVMGILEGIPTQQDLAGCDVSELIVEQRLEGEEFSVESRCTAGSLKPLAMHWKVDIDSSPTKFFERLFVTVPRSMPIYELLVRANETLLHAMQVRDGVFHAEYRLNPDTAKLHPLEVALRPGGGMVSASVAQSVGIDLYEAAVRAALPVPDEDKREPGDVVATGLIFATKPGVLRLIGVRMDDGTTRAVRKDDTGILCEWLQQRINEADRAGVAKELQALLNRNNDLCSPVLAAFDVSAQGGRGLRARIDQVEIWMQPGDVVAEVEGYYVGGLRAVAARGLPPDEALAEAVAAIQLCLAKISCDCEERLEPFSRRSRPIEPIRPAWWQQYLTGGFRSDLDSWTFTCALEKAVSANHGSILDLGCGSARPALGLVEKGAIYAGVDIDPGAQADAKRNLILKRSHGWYVIIGDVLASDWLTELAQQSGREQWDVVAANLPYLPAPVLQDVSGRAEGPSSVSWEEFEKRVHGGPDGLRFIPDRVLDIAENVGAGTVVLNISSLSNMEEFGRRLEARGYKVIRAVATLAPLEEYARSVSAYLSHPQQSFVRTFGSAAEFGEKRQIIYGLQLQKGPGIPCGLLIEQVERGLQPHSARLLTMMLLDDYRW